MSAHLKTQTEPSEAASLRVAKAVESDEALFDETLIAMSAANGRLHFFGVL